MPDIPETTRAQTIFLRAFRKPGGPAPSLWPSPAILRKWLRRPRFLHALNSVLESLRFQSDFHLANAATHAAAQLLARPETSPDNPPPGNPPSDNPPAASAPSDNLPLNSLPADNPPLDLAVLKPLESLLRLAHIRQRFAAVESRYAATQSLTGELAQAQSELSDVRAQLAHAQQELRLSVRLDPFISQRPFLNEAAPSLNSGS